MNRYHIDDAAADRLLSGQLSPEDAPPGYAGVAAMVQTAVGPTIPAELAHESTDVAAGVAAVAAGPIPLSTLSRSRSMIGKLLTAKVLAGTTAIAIGVGTAAAALSGALPTQATNHANAHAKAGLATAASHVGTGGAHASTHATSSSSATSSSTAPTTPSSIQSTGIANSHALFGLCTAFLAGNASSSSGKDSSAAFKALIAETGGSAATTMTFCSNFVMNNHPGGKPSTTGKPSSTGKPSTTGKPTSAGKSSHHAKVTTPNAGGTNTANQASGGASSHGTNTANTASGGASSAGSANAGGHAH